MEIHPFFIFSVFIIIFILIVMKRFFSVPSAERRALAQKEEGKKIKEFALHHFNELKKINPSATLEDDFPENLFPFALKNILKTDNPSREEQMEAIVAINVLFSQQQKTTDINYINKRVKVQRNTIFIDNSFSLRNRQIEIEPIIELEGEIPSISIYEGSKLIRKFNIEPLKSNPNLKILVSIGGWTHSKGFSEAVSSPQGIQKLTQSGIEYLIKHRLDGLDFDWEYPGLPGDNNPYRPEDKENFVLMLKSVREALDSLGSINDTHYLSTIASAGFKEYLDVNDLGQAQKYLDFINIMTFYSLDGLDSVHFENGTYISYFKNN